jgi:hypothetical protein
MFCALLAAAAIFARLMPQVLTAAARGNDMQSPYPSPTGFLSADTPTAVFPTAPGIAGTTIPQGGATATLRPFPRVTIEFPAPSPTPRRIESIRFRGEENPIQKDRSDRPSLYAILAVAAVFWMLLGVLIVAYTRRSG